MNILIADSGATKTEWSLWESGVTKKFTTEGLNPYYHTSDSIEEVVKGNLLVQLEGRQIHKIFFYGAGCDSIEKKKVVSSALGSLFDEAEVEVYHDLLGAARACFFRGAGIACILGTGSNSCLYDGKEVVEHIPSLAFILGDEGSAAYFGRKLINNYFRFELPPELKEALEKDYDMSLEHITHGVYESAQKSRFIASYGAFLGEHADHPYIREILREGFENFIVRILKKYTNAENYEVRFIGSVADAHQEMISSILEENGMKPSLFVRKPMQRLVEFHTDQRND